MKKLLTILISLAALSCCKDKELPVNLELNVYMGYCVDTNQVRILFNLYEMIDGEFINTRTITGTYSNYRIPIYNDFYYECYIGIIEPDMDCEFYFQTIYKADVDNYYIDQDSVYIDIVSDTILIN